MRFCHLALLLHLRIRHRQRQSFLREVEHVEDGGLGASVLAVVDGADHLDDGLARTDDLFRPVLGDDGEFALHQHAVVHHGMVVPAQFLSGGEDIFPYHQFGATLQIVRELRAVPALRGADE